MPGGAKGGDGAADAGADLRDLLGAGTVGLFAGWGCLRGQALKHLQIPPLPVAGCTPKSVLNCWGNLQECLLGLLLEADRWMGKKYR